MYTVFDLAITDEIASVFPSLALLVVDLNTLSVVTARTVVPSPTGDAFTVTDLL